MTGALPHFIVRDSKSGYVLREYVIEEPDDNVAVKELEVEILSGMSLLGEVFDDSELVQYLTNR